MRMHRSRIFWAAAVGLYAAANSTASASPCSSRADGMVLLGTAGGPLPAATRAQSSTLLTVGGENYLIDVGDGAVRRLAQTGIAPNAIKRVFITHNHFDHTGDLGVLLATSWQADRQGAISIYGPPGTRAVVEGALGAFERNIEIFNSEVPRTPPKLGTDVFVHEVVGGQVYKDEQVTVSAVENSHFANFLPDSPAAGRDRSLSYRFDTNVGSVVFTGDTGESQALERLAHNADFLVAEVLERREVTALIEGWAKKFGYSESRTALTIKHMVEAHLPTDVLGRLANSAHVKTVVLTHYVPKSIVDTKVFIEGVREEYAGKIVAGKDLMKIPFEAQSRHENCD